jgi:hypothetical protein
METQDRYVDAALSLARCAADVANYCDHVEHNEVADRCWVVDAGAVLRQMACTLAQDEGQDLRELYARRLRAIEERNPTWTQDALNGAELARRAVSWRNLQLVQAEHDRRYHPDVIGLAKFDQLRHCALHLAKLTGAAASVARGIVDVDDFRCRRLPDLLLFGLKLATIMGEHLPERALVAHDERRLVSF